MFKTLVKRGVILSKYKGISIGAQNKIISAAILIGVILFISYNLNQKNIVQKEPKLTYDDKKYLSDISKKAIEEYLTKGTRYDAENIPEQFLFNNMVVVAFYLDGELQGSGSAKRSNLVDSVIDAAINVINDKISGEVAKKDLANADVLITITKDFTELKNKDVVYLSDNINPGLDGIYLQQGNQSAILIPSTAIQNDWNQMQVLQNLCLQSKLQINCWRDDKMQLYKHDSINFLSKQNSIFDIYRGVPLVKQESVDKETIYKSLIAASDWQLRMQKDDGSYEYFFNPSSQYYSRNDNLIRQALGAYSMAKSYELTGNKAYLDSAEKNIDFILTHAKYDNNFAYVSFAEDSELGSVAVTLIAILELPDYKKYEKEINLFSNFLLFMQRNDGSFKTFYNSNRPDDFDFYPGETMLALAKLHKNTADKKYLEAVEKAFPFYKNYFAKTKHTAFYRWQTSTFYEMYELTKKKEYADFVFEMTDWIIKSQYDESNAPYPDFLGGFSFTGGIPGAGTPVFVEGIADAYKTAKIANDKNRIIKYGKSLKLASRFILQLQFDDINTYYLKNPETAVGAIRESLTSNNLRIDYTSHSIIALSKIYILYN